MGKFKSLIFEDYEYGDVEVPEKYDDLDFEPPSAAQDNAQQVIDWKDEHGRDEVEGMTQTGWQRANQLADGVEVSPDVISRMAQFARHEDNKEVADEYEDTPWKDKGHVAWLGWGGDEGVEWAQEMQDKMDKIDQQNETVKLSKSKLKSTIKEELQKLRERRRSGARGQQYGGSYSNPSTNEFWESLPKKYKERIKKYTGYDELPEGHGIKAVEYPTDFYISGFRFGTFDQHDDWPEEIRSQMSSDPLVTEFNKNSGSITFKKKSFGYFGRDPRDLRDPNSEDIQKIQNAGYFKLAHYTHASVTDYETVGTAAKAADEVSSNPGHWRVYAHGPDGEFKDGDRRHEMSGVTFMNAYRSLNERQLKESKLRQIVREELMKEAASSSRIAQLLEGSYIENATVEPGGRVVLETRSGATVKFNVDSVSKRAVSISELDPIFGGSVVENAEGGEDELYVSLNNGYSFTIYMQNPANYYIYNR